MIKPILAAIVLSLAVVSAALALPPSLGSSPKVSVATDLLQVKSNKGSNKGKWHANKGHGNRYSNAHRYKSAPHGWKNYSYRPYRWAHRGCVVIGPVWYCP
jgi:hypothetical protein